MKKEIQKTLEERLPAVLQGSYRQKYHLMADIGWISDPNGLCQHDGVIHIFHQYTPAADRGLEKSWGHYVTKDYRHFADLGTLMVPDSDIDKDGCYSGSGFSKDGTLHLFYTGNILQDGDFDYINEGRGHFTNTLSSKDGVRFSEKSVLLRNEDYPDHLSCHVRDPKVTKIGDQYYMVIGVRTKDSRGCALLYRCDPDDLEKLIFVQVIDSEQPFGYMWECPVLIELDGRIFLLCCLQGVETSGYDYENIYQNGLFELVKDGNGLFQAVDFHELDHGFDFYAPQSFKDGQSREIAIGWMGMPDADYDYPEQAEGWIHCLTLPRELKLKNGRITQYPISEILELKTDTYPLRLKADQPVLIEERCFVFETQDIQDREFELTLRHDVRLAYHNGILSLKPGKGGAGRMARHIDLKGRPLHSLSVFSDVSSLEIFANQGEEAFTTRVYDSGKDLCLCSSIDLNGKLSLMESIEINYAPALGKQDPKAAIKQLPDKKTTDLSSISGNTKSKTVRA